jgi:hypothetical protein
MGYTVTGSAATLNLAHRKVTIAERAALSANITRQSPMGVIALTITHV